jgi:hypothetical protein
MPQLNHRGDVRGQLARRLSGGRKVVVVDVQPLQAPRAEPRERREPVWRRETVVRDVQRLQAAGRGGGADV